MTTQTTVFQFETDEFGVSSDGIHLLRNGFNYRTVLWKEVRIARITKGKEAHNWLILFFIGVVILFFSVDTIFQVSETFLYKGLNMQSARLIFSLVMMSLLGVFFVINSIRSGTLLILEARALNIKLPLGPIVQEKRLTEFKRFLKSHLRSESSTVKSSQ